MGTDISQESDLNLNDFDKKSDLDELHDELNRSQRKVTSIIESFIELGVSVYDSPPWDLGDHPGDDHQFGT